VLAEISGEDGVVLIREVPEEMRLLGMRLEQVE
jgi:hypothetical protein